MLFGLKYRINGLYRKIIEQYKKDRKESTGFKIVSGRKNGKVGYEKNFKSLEKLQKRMYRGALV